MKGGSRLARRGPPSHACTKSKHKKKTETLPQQKHIHITLSTNPPLMVWSHIDVERIFSRRGQQTVASNTRLPLHRSYYITNTTHSVQCAIHPSHPFILKRLAAAAQQQTCGQAAHLNPRSLKTHLIYATTTKFYSITQIQHTSSTPLNQYNTKKNGHLYGAENNFFFVRIYFVFFCIQFALYQYNTLAFYFRTGARAKH